MSDRPVPESAQAATAASDDVVEAGRDDDVHCPACAYNLHAAPGNVCPECGHALDNLRNAESAIPWTHRRSRGRIRAYWSTVRFVTRRPIPFAEEFAKSLSMRDARLFQVITVLCFYAPAGVATLACYAFAPAPTPRPPATWAPVLSRALPPLSTTAVEEVWPVALLHLGLLLFLLTATSAPTYFVQPESFDRRKQRNMAALSLYACAPLAYFPWLGGAACLLVALIAFDRWGLASWIPVFAWASIGVAVSACGCVVLYWRAIVRLVRRVMPLDTHRAISVAVILPIVWLGLAILLAGCLPALAFYLLLVIASLVG